MLRAASYAVLVLTLAIASPVAQAATCEDVGGVLMTNIAAIDATYNLGPVFGDLEGSVAAKIVTVNEDGTFTLQHYWVTSTGDTILFKPAILHPVATSDSNVVAVFWNNCKSTSSRAERGSSPMPMALCPILDSLISISTHLPFVIAGESATDIQAKSGMLRALNKRPATRCLSKLLAPENPLSIDVLANLLRKPFAPECPPRSNH